MLDLLWPVKKIFKYGLRARGLQVVPFPPSARIRCRDIMRDTFERLSINCVLDVGANEGQFGEQLRSFGYQGHIVSFEPVEANYRVLQKTAMRLGPWTTHRFALGSHQGESEIHVTAQSVFTSLLKPREESQKWAPGNRVISMETVQVKRLDAIWSEILPDVGDPRVFLKIDAQGFDVQVLEGAEGVLTWIHGLQTEVSFRTSSYYEGQPDFAEQIHAFNARGFRVVDFMPVNKDPDGLCAGSMDCIMARKCAS